MMINSQRDGETVLDTTSCYCTLERFGETHGELIATNQRLLFFGIPMKEWQWHEIEGLELSYDLHHGPYLRINQGGEEPYHMTPGNSVDDFYRAANLIMARVAGDLPWLKDS
jgi:hypothetical protein